MGRGNPADRYLPWRDSRGWQCRRCGRCCVDYVVPLTAGEAMVYPIKYGPFVVVANRGRRYLLKRGDGSCIFLTYNNGVAYCNIYYQRPLACRLYPFYITRRPIEGLPAERAAYRNLYVYLDRHCPGVNAGKGIETLVKKAVETWLTYNAPYSFRVPARP